MDFLKRGQPLLLFLTGATQSSKGTKSKASTASFTGTAWGLPSKANYTGFPCTSPLLTGEHHQMRRLAGLPRSPN